MESQIIKSNGAREVYCDICQEPAICAELSLKEWKYKAFVCLKCLDDMRQKLSKQIASINSAMQGIPSPFVKEEKVELKT